MKILLVHSEYRSGHVSGENRVVDDEATLLSQSGHRVARFTRRSVDGPGALARARLGFGMVWNRSAVAELSKAIHVHNPDLVHIHNIFPSMSPAVIRTVNALRKPIVMTLHNYRLSCMAGTFVLDGQICEACLGRSPIAGVRHRCYQQSHGASALLGASLSLHRNLQTFNRVDRYLAVSSFMRDKYIEAGFPENQIAVKDNFSFPTPRRSGPGSYFLYLGRLSPEKGVESLLNIWRRDPPGLALRIVGDGPLLAKLRSAVPLGVSLLGALPPEKIPAQISGARALLVPSEWYEGAPRTIVESYAAGVPVVASNIGGLADIVVDAKTGLTPKPGAERDWRQAIEQLSDPVTAETYGAEAHSMWVTRFSPEVARASIEFHYESVLAAGNRRRAGR